MITTEDLKVLKAPFEPTQHEFLREMVYIREGAITSRIEEIDPAWTFEVLRIYQRGENSIVCEARLTIKGVTRDGVGMANIKDKKRDGTLYDAADPEKSAATDALKRAARLFGVGRYLLDVSDNVKDMDSLADWLNGKNKPDGNVLPIASIEIKQGQKKAYYQTNNGLISDDFKLLTVIDPNAELWSIEVGKKYTLSKPAEAVFRLDKGTRIITAIREWKQAS